MNALSESKKGVTYRRKPDLIGASVDDEMVMMSVDNGQYYGLSGIAPRVWELLETPHTFDQLVDRILEEFKVDRTVCEADMSGFLKEMVELGLVERT